MTNEELCTLAQQGDSNARNLLIEQNIRFIRKISYETWSAQPAINRALGMEPEDFRIECMVAMDRCVDSFDPRSGKFLTYAAAVMRNAMLDYIQSHYASFEAKRLSEMVSPKELNVIENSGKPFFLADPLKQLPEPILLRKEKFEEVHTALEHIEPRERKYLEYRFGFEDDTEHPMTETAVHFRLSESRAKSMEKLALDNVRLELPWWYG